ncbi:DoxX family protein [Haladaptatus salinisoli]|uniref:DoxX family protein n=1 Tax=Haladaptatus salinisoli TaxID=2884876 RepID=UPI001D0A94FC|nr:DoxX family protein [Haladaptatus salinisoli]
MNDSRTWGPLLIRVAVGLVVLVHGVGKLFAVGPAAMPVSKFAGFLAGLGLPFASPLAWVVAVVEVGGGLLLLLGLFTRITALVLAVEMVVATALVHLPKGYSDSELTVVLALAALSLVASGAGELSVDNVLFDGERNSPFATSGA